MKKIKNLKINMLIYSVKSILSVLFPLITFPYVSRVLHVENIGKYNFATSIISYFILIAELGIPTYVTREGAKVRNDRKAIDKLTSEVFTINIISTVISYILLVVCILNVQKLWENRELLLILSISVVLTTMGKEWIYTIYEDYLYLTVRYIVFQVVSIALLFVLVHEPQDYLWYAAISIISSTGANIFNYINAKKYCTVHLMFSRHTLKHLKPILVFFSTTIAVTVYVNADMTMLGFMSEDTNVGLYSVSVKVYNILTSVMVSMVSVTIPRFAALVASGKKARTELETTAKDTYYLLISVLLPMLVGVWVVAKDIIYLVAGEEYMEAIPSLRILSGALVCCIVGYFWGDGILVANGQEKTLLRGTLFSAIINIVLNIFLIPVWQQNAAALTTLISEATSALIFSSKGKHFVNIKGIVSLSLKVGAGCLGICIVSLITWGIREYIILHIICTVIGGMFVYILTELILRNEIVFSIMSSLQQRLHLRTKA